MARRPSPKNEIQDPSLPEKQRARRRFIGATILAACAVVLLPLALESEPRQALGGIDVSIPKRENLGRSTQYWPDTAYRQAAVRLNSDDRSGLFTRPDSDASALDDNRFNPAGGAVQAPLAAAVTPNRTITKVDLGRISTVGDTKANPKSATSKGSAAAKSSPVKSATAKSAVKAAGKPAAIKPPPMPERRADRNQVKAASPSGYVVQIGAFSSRRGALAQVKHAKALGFKAYTEKISTKKGDRIRVRIGPYLDRAQANVARKKLRLKGVETALIAP